MVIPDYKLEPPSYPDPPACPVCGSTTYIDIYKGDGEVIGCDDCVKYIPAEEWWDELEEEKEEALWAAEEARECSRDTRA